MPEILEENSLCNRLSILFAITQWFMFHSVLWWQWSNRLNTVLGSFKIGTAQSRLFYFSSFPKTIGKWKNPRSPDRIDRETKAGFSSSFMHRLVGDGAINAALVNIPEEHTSLLTCSSIAVNYPLCYSCKRGKDDSQGKALALIGIIPGSFAPLMSQPQLRGRCITSSWWQVSPIDCIHFIRY